ncbi:hypothetical protein K6V92_00830 [Cupriavidus respiraculi]|uniref:hypothetical protein n=1 Tax=Cupriavidus respiraculi TaxID=195930 RepID=UPI001C96D96B|nr:hypothetical protein [Cupriavidus respiraculi]MBY4945170.1 hypothetical protein [Cupriavidus respiraculi]
MKQRWIALAAAGLVAACGGDGDRAETPAAPPAQAEEYSLAVRPHLGTVRAGATLAMQPLLDDAPPLMATMPASGDPVFKVPRDRCGPGLVALVGSDSTVYFDEGTNQDEVLGKGQNLRVLVPDICGADATRPVSLSLLDEIGLHIGTDHAADLETKIQQVRDARNGDIASLASARQAAIEAAQRMIDDVYRMIRDLLGLPEGYPGVLPTPIDNAYSVIAPTDAGHVAATLRALQVAAATIRATSMSTQLSHVEAQAALVAQQAELLRAQNAAQKKPVAVIENTLGASTDLSMRFGLLTNGQADNAAKLLGASAANTARDVPSLIERIIAAMPASPTATTSLEKARTKAKAQAPVANADMTLALRTALAPTLLRVEPLERLQKAATSGPGRFACTVGTASRGSVTVTFVDLDTSGGLSDGDRFDMVYQNCLVAEPISGVTMAKSGTMSVKYDARDPVAPKPDIAGHVTFDMRLHADSGAPSTKPATLFRVTGQWMDRAAFGAPGDVAASMYVGARPAVLLDDATLTIHQDGAAYTTQIDEARFDMEPKLEEPQYQGLTAGVLRMAGTVGGLRYSTGHGMLFVRNGESLTLWQGEFSYQRETGGTGSGRIDATAGSLFTTRLTDDAGKTVERALRWDRLVAAYLAN